jgi:bacterioferritin-associated ferredoxin
LVLKVIFNSKTTMIVCVCKAVSERAVGRAIAAGAETIEEVACATGAGSACGSCHDAIQCALDQAPRCGRASNVRVVLPVLAAALSG